MRKLFIMWLALTTSAISSYAQDKVQDRDRDQVQLQEHVMYNDGKLYQIKNQEKVQLTEQLKLQNGTVMNPNGSYRQKDGKNLQLKNGECMDMQGNHYQSQAQMRERMKEHKMEKTQQNKNEKMGGPDKSKSEVKQGGVEKKGKGK